VLQKISISNQYFVFSSKTSKEKKKGSQLPQKHEAEETIF